jgi:hypothetical protein
MADSWGGSWGASWAESWGESGGSPDVTLGLTGQAINAYAGTVKADWHIVSEQGDVDAAMSVPLVGSASTTAAGTLTPGSDVPLSGSESTGETGEVSGGQLLSGASSTAEAGTVIQSSTVPVEGSELTGAQGDVTPASTNDLEQAITGQGMQSGQSVFGTMGGTYVQGGGGGGGDAPRKPMRYAQTLVRQYVGPRRRR